MKEKLTNALGVFGVVLFYLLRLVIAVLPFLMIDCNFIVTFLIVLLCQFIPLLDIIIWIWGLISAFLGPQDVFAIIYYIAFAILFVPFFISLIKSLLNRGND